MPTEHGTVQFEALGVECLAGDGGVDAGFGEDLAVSAHTTSKSAIRWRPFSRNEWPENQGGSG